MDVRDQGNGRHAALGEHVDGLPDGRVLQRHERDAVHLVTMVPEPSRQQFRIEALDVVDLAADVEGREPGFRTGDQAARASSRKRLVPRRQEEQQPHRLRLHRRLQMLGGHVVQLGRGG